jgi:hypothetical protein
VSPSELAAAMDAARMACDDLRAALHYTRTHQESPVDHESLLALTQTAQRNLERLRKALAARTLPPE